MIVSLLFVVLKHVLASPLVPLVGTPGVTAQCAWKVFDRGWRGGKLSGRLVVDGLLACYACELLHANGKHDGFRRS